ncbi:MAG: hypothetical protein OXU41_08810 [Gammaproteobacteria bacterium]|nr:hypothetical protein [Gammaproteobacteria bacterium]
MTSCAKLPGKGNGGAVGEYGVVTGADTDDVVDDAILRNNTVRVIGVAAANLVTGAKDKGDGVTFILGSSLSGENSLLWLLRFRRGRQKRSDKGENGDSENNAKQ